MHSLCHSARRLAYSTVGAGAAAASAAVGRRALPAAAAAAAVPAATCGAVRMHSTLPIIEEYVRSKEAHPHTASRSHLTSALKLTVRCSALRRPSSGTYPFPTILESNIPPDYSQWLWYHQQHPHDLPTYKSRLVVDIRDLGLDATSRMVLREMVQGRYDPRAHTIAFVSKNLPTAAANENRVFQMLDACLLECRRIGAEMNAQGFHAKPNKAKQNRLLRPVPKLPDLIAKEKKKNEKAKAKRAAAKNAATAAATPTDAAAASASVSAASSASASATPAKKSVSYTRSQQDHRALGMESPHTSKPLPPQVGPLVAVLPRHRRKRVKADPVAAAAEKAKAKTIRKATQGNKGRKTKAKA